MARELTAARATVAPGDRATYLAILAELARRRTARGQHLWVFTRRDVDGAFLEFREGPAGASPGDADEAALEARLGTVARYEAGADVRWDEVPLSIPTKE